MAATAFNPQCTAFTLTHMMASLSSDGADNVETSLPLKAPAESLLRRLCVGHPEAGQEPDRVTFTVDAWSNGYLTTPSVRAIINGHRAAIAGGFAAEIAHVQAHGEVLNDDEIPTGMDIDVWVSSQDDVRDLVLSLRAIADVRNATFHVFLPSRGILTVTLSDCLLPIQIIHLGGHAVQDVVDMFDWTHLGWTLAFSRHGKASLRGSTEAHLAARTRTSFPLQSRANPFAELGKKPHRVRSMLARGYTLVWPTSVPRPDTSAEAMATPAPDKMAARRSTATTAAIVSDLVNGTPIGTFDPTLYFVDASVEPATTGW